MRTEHIHVTERRVPQTRDRTPVMQQLSNLVPATPHHLEPLLRDRPQLPGALLQPGVDPRIPFHRPIESEEFHFHRQLAAAPSSRINAADSALCASASKQWPRRDVIRSLRMRFLLILSAFLLLSCGGDSKNSPSAAEAEPETTVATTVAFTE